MYFLGKTYHISRLVDLAYQKFVDSTATDDFSLDQLLWTAEYLYAMASWLSDLSQRGAMARTTRKLRMRVIYLAQKCEAVRLCMKPKFKELMKAGGSFNWDFTAKCFQARWLLCPGRGCEAVYEPKVGKGECDCGGEGVCEVCVVAKREGRKVQMPLCGKCGKAKLARWNLENVDVVDMESVKALGEMFHPA